MTHSTENAPERQLLSRAECAALRGIAILGIVLHNYCHWLGFAVKENEYTFTAAKNSALMAALAHPDLSLPVHLLSFFGHYGVPVFLFLSAYGLVMKYEKGHHAEQSRRAGAWKFIVSHYRKLFAMMIVGFVAFTMVDAITPGRHHYAVTDILAQLLMVNNILPDPDHIIWPGPFWFFGLMLQLYIVYRLLLYRRGWKPLAVLVLLCWLMQAVCDPESDTLNRIRYNFMGGIVPFAAGLLFARYGRELGKPAWATIVAVGVVLIVLFGGNFQTWLWIPPIVCAVSIGAVKLFPDVVNRPLAWVGTISAALFVMHPVARKVFIPISRHGDVYTGLLLYIIAAIALAVVADYWINRRKRLQQLSGGNAGKAETKQ